MNEVPDEVIADDAGLGFTRVNPVIIQIFTQSGRTVEAKQGLYAAIANRLSLIGLADEDSFIS